MSKANSITAGEAVFKTLGAYRRGTSRSTGKIAGQIKPLEYLDTLLVRHKLNAPDRALATQILRGVLQNLLLCDYYIAKFSSLKIGKIEPQILDILRSSVYQLKFLTKIPKSAIVNEAVKLAGTVSKARATGYVNALLRGFANAVESEQLPEISLNSDIETLSVKYSHPQWLVSEFCKRLEISDIMALLEYNNSSCRPIYAQVNTLRASMERVIELLDFAGVQATQHKWLENCIQLYSAGNIAELEVYKKGLIYVQDPASKLAVMAAKPKSNDYVIDACASPGGKSFAASIIMNNTGIVVSGDLGERKLSRISDGAKRLGIENIREKHVDALVFNEEYSKVADIVLADLPCSGFGVLHKKPEIRYKTKDDIQELPDIQKRMLSNLSRYVKPGGILLYSTCTLLRSENEDVVECFLSEQNDFKRIGFALDGFGHVHDGQITLWPHTNKTDGFFICKFIKNEP